MDKRLASPVSQQVQIASKVTSGLERLSEAFKFLLWDHAKRVGISPIQIQIIIFVKSHAQNLCSVSYLAKEFNVTKATISDAVKSLRKKNIIIKTPVVGDGRSYLITLSKKGKEIEASLHEFTDPIKNEVSKLGNVELDLFYKLLHQLIYRLNQVGILSVQRICYGCSFYTKKDDTHFCGFLKKPLVDKEIRLDCSEYEKNADQDA